MEPLPSLAFIFTAFVVAIALSGVASESTHDLPENVIPSGYKILLSPEFVNFTFTGVSEIEVTVKEDNTKKIVLHAKELKIKSAVVIKQDSIISAESTTDNTTGFLTLIPDEEINSGNYVLKLEYTGQLHNDTTAFYYSSYVNDEGNQVWFAATHFTGGLTRYAFPCWDEPKFRATFLVSIKHSHSYTALSNTDVLSRETEENDETQNITKFTKTPEMPPQLVSFVVSDFDTLSNGFFRIWYRKSVVEKARTALKSWELVWEKLQNITGMTQEEIGFQKLDIVALPNYRTTPPKSWGLLIGCEREVLIEEKNIGTITSMRFVLTLIYDTPYQWLIKLASPLSVKDMWITEGINHYFQYELLDKIIPKHKDSELLGLAELGKMVSIIMFPDSDAKAQGLATGTASDSKGGTYFKMIRHILGEKSFLNALRSYFEKAKVKGATLTDLIAEFAAVSTYVTPNLTSVLNHWAYTPGYPLVTVIRDYAAGTASLTQERFLYEPNATYAEFYFVPINYATQGKKDFDNTTVTSWLNNFNGTTVINGGFAKDEWVIFNKQQFGYYRVNYDNENWRLIAEALKAENFSDIPLMNRMQFISDVGTLLYLKKLDYGIFLNVFGFLEHETHPMTWSNAISWLRYFHRDIMNTAQYDNFKTYAVRLMDNFLRDDPYEDLPSLELPLRKSRTLAAKLYCQLGAKPCIDYASKKFMNWLNDNKTEGFSSDMIRYILCTGMHSADSITWNRVFEEYLSDPKLERLAALVCTSNEQLLADLFKKTLTKLHQYWITMLVIEAFTLNPNSIDSMLDSLIQYQQMISKKIESEYMKYIVNYVTAGITTKTQLDKWRKILAGYSHLKPSEVDTAIEKAENKVLRVINNGPEIAKFFERTELDSSAPEPTSAVPLTE